MKSLGLGLGSESALGDEDKSRLADEIILRLKIWKSTHLMCLERLYMVAMRSVTGVDILQ